MMKATYFITNEDILAYYKHQFKKHHILYKPYIWGITFILALIFRYSYPFQISYSHNGVIQSTFNMNIFINVFLIFGFLIAIVYFFRFLLIARTGDMIGKNLSLMGGREIELLDDKITISSKDTKTERSIDSIVKIEEVNDYYFTYFDTQIALIIPKRIPNSKELISEITKKRKLNVC
jgi:predicted membrane protein